MFRTYRRSSEKSTSSLSAGNASIKRPSIVIPAQQELSASVQPAYDALAYDINGEEIIDLQAPSSAVSAAATTHTYSADSDMTLESMSAVLAAAVQLTSNVSHSKKSPSSLSLGTASIVSSPTTPTNAPTTPRRRFSTRLLFNAPWKRSASTPLSNNTTNTPVSPVPSSPCSFTTTTPSTPGLEPCSPIFPNHLHHHSSLDMTTDDDDDNSTVVSEQQQQQQQQQEQRRSRSISSATSMSSHSSRSITTMNQFAIDDDGRDELIYRGIQVKEIKSTLKTLVISDEIRYPMPEVRLERPGFARINY